MDGEQQQTFKMLRMNAMEWNEWGRRMHVAFVGLVEWSFDRWANTKRLGRPHQFMSCITLYGKVSYNGGVEFNST